MIKYFYLLSHSRRVATSQRPSSVSYRRFIQPHAAIVIGGLRIPKRRTTVRGQNVASMVMQQVLPDYMMCMRQFTRCEEMQVCCFTLRLLTSDSASISTAARVSSSLSMSYDESAGEVYFATS